MSKGESVCTASSRTYHPFTGADQAVMAQVRAMVEPNKGKLRGVAARPAFDDIIRHTSPPEGVDFREGRVGGVSGWWAEPKGAAAGRVVLHLHGGWFNWGTAEAYRNLVGHVARRAAAAAFVPNYSLAPEHSFPAAGLDASATLGGLIADGARAVAITGDSAGGNLALALLSSATARTPGGRRCIVGAVVLSPVTDLTLGGASWVDRAQADPFFLKDQVQGLIDAYLAGHEPTDPAASPLFADPTGFPPIRLHVGDAEVLLDDAVRYGGCATAAGVDAQVDVWEGMAHGFLGSVGRLQAADAALDAIGAFLRDRLWTP
ncbi:MAG: alpha/beta hydrolase fold domain-containing protein [Acetobacteraceae bacterium]